MDIYEVDRWLMDLMERYENGKCNNTEIYFLQNLRSDLDELIK